MTNDPTISEALFDAVFPPETEVFSSPGIVSLLHIPKPRSPMLTLAPTEDRIVIKEDEATAKIGSLYVPDTGKDKPFMGTVLAVGPGKFLGFIEVEAEGDKGLKSVGDASEFEPMPCKPGDRVVFSKYSGSEVELEGEKFIIMRASDILAVVVSSE